jgi:peptidyl-prolyl cis-trans isomerase A (cyclophilin A)
MRNYLVIILTGLLLVAFVAGCPKKQAAPPVTDSGLSGVPSQQAQDLDKAADGTTPADPGTNPDGTPKTDPAATLPPADATTPPAADAPKTETPKGVTNVILETTKGKIVLAVHPEWAPLGAEHFLMLVNAKFYDGAPWFRVMPGFVAQCGVAADPKLNEKYMQSTIADEPVIKGNKRGFVSFGNAGPNSRSTHIFINYGDNSNLDAQAFSAFAEVVEGMDVADKLYACQFENQGALASEGGMAAFKKMFPQADYITKAYVKK